MNDTIEKYNKFVEDNQLRTILPEMKKGYLVVTTKRIKSSDLKDYIKEVQQSWFMYTDSIELGYEKNFDNNRHLLECEYVSGNETIKIRLLHDLDYLVTCFKATESTDNQIQMCYNDILLLTRKDLRKQVKKLVYRQWYKLDNNGGCEPYVQQFIGFEE